MKGIRFVRSPTVDKVISDSGYQVYRTVGEERDGFIETIDYDADNLMKLLEELRADPEIVGCVFPG